MDVRELEITVGAVNHGRLSLRVCGKEFFPTGILGTANKKDKQGERVCLRIEGFSKEIHTDIPTDSKNAPRWFFRDRTWVKPFIKSHHLAVGDKLKIIRLSKKEYKTDKWTQWTIWTK